MLLVKKKEDNEHVSIDTVREFENTIIRDENVKRHVFESEFTADVLFFFYRVFTKFGVSTVPKTKKKYLVNPLKDKGHLMTIMMGLDSNKFKKNFCTTSHCRSVYLFDAWPSDYEKIIAFACTYKIDFIFVTSSQSAKVLSKELSMTSVHWIPEGINPNEYKHLSIEKKTIDILAIGREYDYYHEQILDYCDTNNLKYLFEKNKGELVFPTRHEFIEGLASAKISICVPSNITHPQRAGNVETMTIRYLQSMLSKCLLVGHAPAEMVKLFGYNPVIEIDKNAPVEQLDYILKNYFDYEPLIEKNYQLVLQHHTWSNRWNQIKGVFTNKKYNITT
jgi:glycosyltransferase involved in cell wall biosynthesis